MFGFKSKKDKRIEELERQLQATYMKSPKVLTIERDIVVLGANIAIEPGMPVEYAKEMLARKMVEEVKQFMTFDLEDETGNSGHPLFSICDSVGESRPVVLETTVHNELTTGRITAWRPLPEPYKEDKKLS